MTISLETIKERNNNLIERLLTEFERVEGGTTSSTSLYPKPDESKLETISPVIHEVSSSNCLIKFYSGLKTDLKTELKTELKEFWLAFHRQVKSEFYNEAEVFRISRNVINENILDSMMYKLVLHHLLTTNASEEQIDLFIHKQKCSFMKKEITEYLQKFKKAEKMKKFLSQGDFKAVAKEIDGIMTFKSVIGKRFNFCIRVLDYITEIFLFFSKDINDKGTSEVDIKADSDDKLKFLEQIRLLSTIIDEKESDINHGEMIELVKIIIKQPLDKKLIRDLKIDTKPDTSTEAKTDTKTDESSILLQIKRIKQLYYKEATLYISDVIYEEFQIPVGDPLLSLFKAGCPGLRVLCESEIFKETFLFTKEQLRCKCIDTKCLIHSGEEECQIKNDFPSPLSDSDHEIPIELPFSEQHHSIIICPVLKTPCDKLNPPLVLECFHVISREAVKRLNTVKGIFDCPYCPNKSDINEVFEIFYE